MGRGRTGNEASEGLIPTAIVFGLGFTGQRLARRLLVRGGDVCAAVREPGRFQSLGSIGLKLVKFGEQLPEDALLFHSIPPLENEANEIIRREIRAAAPRRVVYISSTGVYGRIAEVNHRTEPAPDNERARRRLEEEGWITAGPWSSLILRAAAIYGPGRGVHAAVREGRMARGSFAGVVSRIHVDDLAAISEAGLFEQAGGAWPVADERPCASAEIQEWVLRLINIESRPEPPTELYISGRRVDGQAIRETLGIRLEYPSWEAGILASLAEESAAAFRRAPR